MDIGFIGLGNMGAPMARRLLEAGHKVVVYDTRQEAIGNLAAVGAVAARSPAEVGDNAEIVMASLPTPHVVLNVATGQNGVIEGKRVRRFVDLSTTGAIMAKRIFEALKTRNIVQIDEAAHAVAFDHAAGAGRDREHDVGRGQAHHHGFDCIG